MHSKNLAEHHKISLCGNLTKLCVNERYMQPQLCFKLSGLPLAFLNVLSCKLFADIIINGNICHYSREPFHHCYTEQRGTSSPFHVICLWFRPTGESLKPASIRNPCLIPSCHFWFPLVMLMLCMGGSCRIIVIIKIIGTIFLFFRTLCTFLPSSRELAWPMRPMSVF